MNNDILQAKSTSGMGNVESYKAEPVMGVTGQPLCLPKMLRVKIRPAPHRGYHLIRPKTGESIKFINKNEANAISSFKNMFMWHYPCKRLIAEEYNQFNLHKHLKNLAKHYKKDIFFENMPVEIKRAIVVDREHYRISSSDTIRIRKLHAQYIKTRL
jgi:hypothetical protein